MLAYFSVALAIGNFGLDRVAARSLAVDIRFSQIGTLAALRIGAAAFCSACLLLLGVVERAIAAACAVFAFAVFPVAVSAVITPALQARERQIAVASSSLFSGGVLVAAVLVLPVQSYSGWQLALLFAGTEASKAFFLFWAAHDLGLNGRLEWSPREARALAQEAVPHAAMATLSVLYLRADLMLLERLSGPESVAGYAAVYRVLDALTLLPALALGLVFPRIARTRQHSTREAGELYLAITRRLLWSGVTIAGVMIAFAEPVLRLLFADRYLSATPAFVGLMIAAVFVFWHASNGFFLFAERELGWMVGVSAIFLALNLCLNLWSIPRYGSLGAAISTALSEALATLVFGVLVCKRLEIGLRGYLAGIVRPWLPGADWIVTRVNADRNGVGRSGRWLTKFREGMGES